MAQTSFETLASLGERLEKTSSRLQMRDMIAQFLRELASDELQPGVRLLLGQVFPEWDARTLNLSWRSVLKAITHLTEASDGEWQDVFDQAVDAGEAVRLLLERMGKTTPLSPSLNILEVYATLETIAEARGKGSRKQKEELLESLLSRANPLEAKYLVKNILREMRHGVSEGILLDAIAEASGAKQQTVRRANMFLGDLGEVALLALHEGQEGLEQTRPLLFRPLKPMLAQPVQHLREALEFHRGEIALEYKLDGARVQIHKDGPVVKIFTRNLSQVTASLPEVVDQVLDQTQADEAILEGEVIAIDRQGRPLPFQHLMRRFRRVHDVEKMAQQVPVQLHLFDLLYRDGDSLVDRPYEERRRILEQTRGTMVTAARNIPHTLAEGEEFAEQAYRDGHEGVMVKHLFSSYRPGVRGKSWFKVKHTLSLDVVIVAADWGYGRRHGWLSNYHLAVREEDSGAFLEVGKTFKGLTDVEFQLMTERLLALEAHRKGGTVYVEPRVMVEVLFNEIQASPQYESGFALRFARISRLREDKKPADADTLQTLTELFSKQFAHKGRLEETEDT
ncbi:MAG TPA: ATP-dependent DNA ligase [Anaerolineae bacterium]|nr:ATP-dependent DNA ligase [Anaerolineae bacterium]